MVCSVPTVWFRFSSSIESLSDPFFGTCGSVFVWDWVGIVAPIKGEASSSSQFQSSISESGYSGMLTSESSRLESQLVAGSSSGSSLSLSGWSAVGSVPPKAVVTTVIGGSGACPV